MPDMTPTAAEVIAEGQIKEEYFPNVATAGLSAFVTSKITACEAILRAKLKAVYTNATGDDAAVIKLGLTYLVLGQLWAMIVSVMISYDAEALPAEWVSPEAAAANRDFYLGQAQELLADPLNEANVSTPKAYVGCFTSGGAEDAPSYIAEQEGDSDLVVTPWWLGSV